MRKQGISEKLLKKVCLDAATEEYDYIEAYPGTNKTSNRSYHGSFGIYMRNGFTVHKTLDDEAIVRKYL